MKNLIIIFLILINGLNLNAQEISVNPIKMNVAYIGVDNPIRIMANGIECEELKITVGSGSLTQLSACDYIFKPEKQGAVRFKIFHKGKEIGNYEYRVKRIPDPQVTLGGKLGPGHINKGTIAAQSGLIAILKNFDFDARFTIMSFSMLICSKDFYYLEHQDNGPVLTSTMKEAIHKINGKATVFFTDVLVKGPDKIERNLPEIYFSLIGDNSYEDCPHNQYIKRTNFYERNDSIFSAFNCPCNKQMLKIETDKTIYKGQNNEYFFSSETLKTDSSETYLEYYENGQISLEKHFVLKNYSLDCQDEKPLQVYKLHLFQYKEYYENGKPKLSGNYRIKESLNQITEEEINEMARLSGCGSISKCNYTEDVKHGTWFYYNEKGKLIRKEVFELGELVKPKKYKSF